MPDITVKKITKKQQIIDTAEALFKRHGIKRITIEEICRQAKVSKMTFYKHFENKINLLNHIWDDWIEQGFSKLDEISALDIPFPEKIERMFKWKTAFAYKINVEFIEDFLHLEVGLERIRKRFLQFIVDSQKKGHIRPGIRPEFIMAVSDKLYELAGDENLVRLYPNFMEFNRELKDFLWYGLLTRENG